MQPVRTFFREAALVVAAVVRPAFRSLRDNPGLAAVSVVLAFGLWIVVTEAENPTRTRVFEQDLPVEPINVDPSVVVSRLTRIGQDSPATVRVRVSVEEDVFPTLTKGDFDAVVDLEGLTVGDYQRPVEVRTRTTRGGLRVEEVLPPEVAVVLVPRESKRVPVVITVSGDPAPGYTMDSPQPEETEVTVSGPGDKVALVTQAAAEVDVEGRSERFSQALRLRPRDDLGNLVDKVSVDPPIVSVTIPIQQTAFSRSVTVSPLVTGVPADGYNVVNVSSNPVNVTIRGEPSAIIGINTISTEAISVEDETETIVKSVQLQLPPGVSVIGSSNVTVSVRIEPARGIVRLVVPLTVRGLGPGLSVKRPLPDIEVTLTGELPDLLELAPVDISATADLTGKDAGVHRVKVDLRLPEGLDAETSADPAEVELTLEKS